MADHDERSRSCVVLCWQISYYSPVDPSLFGLLSLVLIGSGLSFMALFFVYEMKVGRGARQRYDMYITCIIHLLTKAGRARSDYVTVITMIIRWVKPPTCSRVLRLR